MPSFSSVAVAGRITCAQSVASFGKSDDTTTDSARCRASRQRLASGPRETGSASPSTHEHAQLAALGAVEHARRVGAEAGGAHAELVRRLGQRQDAAGLAGESAARGDRRDELERKRIGDEQHGRSAAR